MNADGYFDTTKPQFNQNQFGGTFGGPIKKDRTFFLRPMKAVASAREFRRRLSLCPVLKNGRQLRNLSVIFPTWALLSAVPLPTRPAF